jgi:hypothetical protein
MEYSRLKKVSGEVVVPRFLYTQIGGIHTIISWKEAKNLFTPKNNDSLDYIYFEDLYRDYHTYKGSDAFLTRMYGILAEMYSENYDRFKDMYVDIDEERIKKDSNNKDDWVEVIMENWMFRLNKSKNTVKKKVDIDIKYDKKGGTGIDQNRVDFIIKKMDKGMLSKFSKRAFGSKNLEINCTKSLIKPVNSSRVKFEAGYIEFENNTIRFTDDREVKDLLTVNTASGNISGVLDGIDSL